MKIKRFSTIAENAIDKISKIIRLNPKEVLFSDRQDEIQTSLDKADSIGIQILKLIEFYDLDGFDFNHWIDGLADKLGITASSPIYKTPLALGKFAKNENYLDLQDKDVKKKIFNGNSKNYGIEFLNGLWNNKDFQRKYRKFIQINNNKRIYDDTFYLNLFDLLCRVINDPNILKTIDNNTIYQMKYRGIVIKKSGNTLNKSEIKNLLKEFIIKVKGYEN